MKKHNKVILLVFLFAFLGLFATINQKTETSSVTFKINNFGSAVSGSFSKFNITVDYNKNSPLKSVFNGEIFVSSINTGIGMRDKHLKEEDYFDEKKYPKISFKSLSIISKNDSLMIVNGNLTIKNVTKKISLNVNIKEVLNKTIFTTSIKINRRDYNVGGNSFTLSDDLTAFIKFVK